MINVIDYGTGNLLSVSKALDFLNVENKITNKAEDIEKSEKIILPGVGNFGDAMKSLEELNLIKPIKDFILQGKPFLGICLGLQLLFEKSEESPGINGFEIFKGEVKKFKVNLKIPQIGWNQAEIKKDCSLMKGIKDKSFFYFIHSYYVSSEDESIVLTKTNYSIDFISGVCKDNIFALQFHPEKSGNIGLEILKNFVNLK